MATQDPRRVSDGMLSCEGGIDSGRSPSLLNPNQLSFMVNGTVRGGYPTTRPGFRKLDIEFPSDETTQTNFQTGRFQIASAYQGDDGNLFLISMHGGHVFRALVNAESIAVNDISITGDLNPSNRPIAWAIQAENYWLMQDGQTKPFIFNGSTARRAGADEIPVGRQMAYIMNRLYVANGRSYVIGDIEYGPSGTPATGYRDALLKFTENTFLNEGGSFGVPANMGNITGIKAIANMDTVLGQGEAVITTENGVLATQLPPDRTQWKNTTQPLQRVIQLHYGATSQNSLVNVNGDLFYRSKDGFRSLMFALRYFNDWGQSPISKEMNRIIVRDDRTLLGHCNGVLFDNRLLETISPYPCARGVAHRGLAVLDFDLLSSIKQRLPPSWEGIWTGLNVLQVIVGQHNGVDRCFVYAINSLDKIEVWELTLDAHFDVQDNTKNLIQWFYETRSMDFGNKFDLKKLETADFYYDNVDDEVTFDLKYRPDGFPCWIDWETWTECSKTDFCPVDFTACPTLKEYKMQHRPKYHTRQPRDDFDPVNRGLLRNFFEVQFRHAFTGYCRVKQSRYSAYTEQESPNR